MEPIMLGLLIAVVGVLVIVIVTAMPYAATRLPEVRKPSTSPMQASISM